MSNFHLLIVITLLCWGSVGIFDKKAVQISQPASVVYAMFVQSALLAPVAFLALQFYQPGWHVSSSTLIWTFLSTCCYSVAWPAYALAMRKTDASYVLGITASYPLILQFLAVPLLGEKLITSRIFGAGLIGLGVALIGSSPSHAQKELPLRDKLLLALYIVTATLGWGVWGLFDKKALADATPLLVFFVQRGWDVLVVLGYTIWALCRRCFPDLSNRTMWGYAGLSEVCIALGSWTYLNAMNQAQASYVIAITGCYPLLMYLLALFFLGEKFSRLRFAGIVLVCTGGILVQLSQSQ